jgi:hypothetical protein
MLLKLLRLGILLGLGGETLESSHSLNEFALTALADLANRLDR